VEEQPFDRFYKKPDKTAQHTMLTPQAQTQSLYEPRVPETIAAEAVPSRKVYINFPGTFSERRSSPISEKPVAPVAENKIDSVSVSSSEALTDTAYIAESYSSTPREERSLYKQLAEKQTSSRKSNSDRRFVYIAIAACIVLAGVLLILFYNYRTQQERLKELNTIVNDIQNQKSGQPALNQPNNETPPAPQVSETIVNPELLNGNENLPTENSGIQQATAGTAPASKQPAKVTDSVPPIVFNEKRPVRRRETTDETAVMTTPQNETANAGSSENIFTQVSVTTNNYKVGVLGGISNLQLALKNNSSQQLHRVAVEIKYLGPEKKVVNRQTVYFESIAPGTESTIDVPKSKRGVSIEYTITDIKS
jgi:hypothetical protein